MSAAPFQASLLLKTSFPQLLFFNTARGWISYCVWLVEVKFSWWERKDWKEPLFLPLTC